MGFGPGGGPGLPPTFWRCGALLLFAGDLILYMPQNANLRTATTYFTQIDGTGGKDLARSPMANISVERMMLGGVLGPIAPPLRL